MEKIQPRIQESWKEVLEEEFDKPYFLKLKNFLMEEKKKQLVYPPGSQIFNAFNFTSFGEVRVVILGQDPYHGQGQAHGLCFSVPFGIKPPPSLVNIYKELKNDLGIPIPGHGNLESWATQGVFLLNATLTVRANQAGSHQNKGWEEFTDRVIGILSEKRSHLVFMLWGKYAGNKLSLIDADKHLILTAPHPSPLSAHAGFFGCGHFSEANRWLLEKGMDPIDWSITDFL